MNPVLPPIRAPFTLLGRAGGGAAQAEGLPSWGRRLGLWWSDSEEADGGVVVTGMLKDAALAKALSVGDVIVAVDTDKVKGLGDLTRYLDRFGSGAVQFIVRGQGGEERAVAVRLPDAPATASTGPGAPDVAAHIPTCTLLESLSTHIQLILSHPIQSEVTHPGVAADPDFGCLGADLEFSIQNVGLSEIRNAIVNCEPRLADVQVDAAELEMREDGETVVRPGIRVTGTLVGTGEAVRIDLEIDGVTRRRRSRSRRVDGGAAGLEQR